MRVSRQRYRGRGDTIIEVIFAVAIFSFVAISSLMLMNKGIATGERALEITLVRQEINAQAEALRFIHEASVVTPSSSYAETWSKFATTYRQANPSPFGVSGDTCLLPGGTYRPFVLNTRTATIWTSGSLTLEYEGTDEALPPYPQVAYKASDPTAIEAAYGMWVEAVPSSAVLAKQFIDFHIRACWSAPGMNRPMTLGTIVRLYDPTT